MYSLLTTFHDQKAFCLIENLCKLNIFFVSELESLIYLCEYDLSLFARKIDFKGKLIIFVCGLIN